MLNITDHLFCAVQFTFDCAHAQPGNAFDTVSPASLDSALHDSICAELCQCWHDAACKSDSVCVHA